MKSVFIGISIVVAAWFIHCGLTSITKSYSMYAVLHFFVILFAVYFAVGYIFYYVDVTKKPDWLHRRKYQADVCVSIEKYKNIFKTMAIKMILIILPVFYVTFYIMHWRIKTFPNVISWMQKNGIVGFILCLLAVYVIADLTAWFVHKMLHKGVLWSKVHKQHHLYTSPVAIASLDAHPIEIIFWDLLPFIIGPLLLGTSPGFLGMFAIISIINTALCHSGYDVGYDDGHHDLHHERLKCNYSGHLSDMLFGTYVKRENKIYPRFDAFQKDIFGSKNDDCKIISDSFNKSYFRAVD